MKLPLLALCVVVVSLVTGYPFPPPPGAPYPVDADFGVDNLPRLSYDSDGQLEAFQPYPAAPEFNAPVDVEATNPAGSEIEAQEGDQEEGRRFKGWFKQIGKLIRKVRKVKKIVDKVKQFTRKENETVEE